MGSPWGQPPSQGASSSSSYYSSSRWPGQHDENTYSTASAPGSMTSHSNPWHHTMRTTSSHTSWPSMASDNRSVSVAPSQTHSPTPIPHLDHDLSEGALAAAVVVPTLTVFSAIILIFLCLRRRTRTTPQSQSPMVPATAVIKEKLGSFKRRPKPPPGPPQPPTAAAAAAVPPIVTSSQNNAYYTGLDTSSLGSRGGSGEYQPRASYEPPPPPYVHDASPPPPCEGMRIPSPFDDPEHDHGIVDGMLFPRRDSASNRSVSSTLYSDSASVHEAREARRSLGGAQMIEAVSFASAEGGSDPFVSPVGSPTASRAEGGGWRRGSDGSEVSEVSAGAG